MINLRAALLTLAFGLGLLSSHTLADEPPTVSFFQAAPERLKADLKLLVDELAANPKAWSKVEQSVDVFLPDVDLDRPMRVDLILDPKAEAELYRSSFPVAAKNQRSFIRDNLRPLGINATPRGRNLWAAAGAFVGFVRFDANYASFAVDQNLIPAGYDPFAGFNAKLFADYDWIMEFKNDPANKDGMKDRQDGMKKVRDELLAGVKQGKDEDPSVYELKKLSAEQNLKELERFFVESESVFAGWNTDEKGKAGSGAFTLKAIPGTDLETSVKDQAVKASRFAALEVDPKSASALRVNFALDELRISNLKAFFAAVRKPMELKIPNVKKWDAEQQTAAKSLGNLFIDMLDQTLEAKVVDGFFDATESGSAYEVVGAFVVTDPTKMDKLVTDYPKLEEHATVDLKVAEVEGVTIHKIQVTEDVSPGFTTLFSAPAVVYVGTGKDTVWFSVGEKTLPRLKEAIEKVAKAEPAEPTGRMLYYHGKLLPLVKATDAQAKGKGRTDLRAAIIKGLASGADYVEVTMDHKGDQIEGKATVKSGILAAVGQIIAQFAEKNL